MRAMPCNLRPTPHVLYGLLFKRCSLYAALYMHCIHYALRAALYTLFSTRRVLLSTRCTLLSTRCFVCTTAHVDLRANFYVLPLTGFRYTVCPIRYLNTFVHLLKYTSDAVMRFKFSGFTVQLFSSLS